MENISIYPIIRENFDKLREISKDKSIARFISFGDDLEKVLARANLDNHVWYGIFVDNVLIGDMLCELFDDKVYLGIRIINEYRAQGIGSVALQLMGAEIVNLNWQFISYAACIEKDNFVSLKFFNSLGFHCAGIDKDGYLVFEKPNPNVALIPLRDSHAKYILDNWALQDNMRALYSLQSYNTLDKVKALLQEWGNHTFLGKFFLPFLIAVDGKIIGIADISGANTVEIAIDTRFRHLGHGASALSQLVKVATSLNYTELFASCDIGDIGAKRIFLSAGFLCKGARMGAHGMTVYDFEYDIIK